MRAGVERAILDLNLDHPSAHTLKVVEAAPERLSLAGRVDPRKPMEAVRKLRAAHAELPLVSAKIIPFMQDLPPTHASHYPVYAACTELDGPIQINTGIPGPPLPSACQDPIHLDRVCFDFPDLTVVMAHLADPAVGRSDPPDDQVAEPPPDDLRLPPQVPPREPPPLHAHPRPQQGDVRLRPSTAGDRQVRGGSGRTSAFPPEILEAYAAFNAERVFWGGGTRWSEQIEEPLDLRFKRHRNPVPAIAQTCAHPINATLSVPLAGC